MTETTANTGIVTTARNADLQDVLGILKDQRARRLDIVANSPALRMDGGNLFVADALVGLGAGGAEERFEGEFVPTAICDEKMAARLDVPQAYFRRLRAQGRVDVLDANFNMLMHGGGEITVDEDGPHAQFPADPREHLVRLLQGDPGKPGVARAMMSRKYKFIESLDWLLAVLAGVNGAGATPLPPVCDLSDRRFYMRLEMPQVAALAPKLLDGYRNPFGGAEARQRAGFGDRALRQHERHGQWTVAGALAAAMAEGQGYEPGKEPVVWAGIVCSDSDTGDGSAYIAPQLRVRVCRNGLTMDMLADKQVHLGGAQNVGAVDWSQETAERELALVTSQVTDLVRQWCSQEWLNEQVAKVEAMASAPVTNAQAQVKEVAKATGFSQVQTDAILALFIDGGQATAGGLANAVTAQAQIVGSPEEAHFLERHALEAMERMAKLVRR